MIFRVGNEYFCCTVIFLGRGKDKKMMEILIPALMGFKATTIGAVAFTAIAALVMKAMGVASIALIVTLCLLVAKLFSAPHVIYPKHVELDAHASEHHPVFADFPLHETGKNLTVETPFILSFLQPYEIVLAVAT